MNRKLVIVFRRISGWLLGIIFSKGFNFLVRKPIFTLEFLMWEMILQFIQTVLYLDSVCGSFDQFNTISEQNSQWNLFKNRLNDIISFCHVTENLVREVGI